MSLTTVMTDANAAISHLHRLAIPNTLQESEVLFADDTVILCTSPEAAQDKLQNIDDAAEAQQSGLHLQRSTCKVFMLNCIQEITFADDQPLRNTTICKYLGSFETLARRADLKS